MSWDKTEGGDFGHSGGTSRAENFIRGLNIELANERNLRAKAEAEVERLRAENALLRKVEEVGEILWSEAICHRCNARECRGCAAHDFKRAMSEYQSWKEGQELDKEGAE